jgi:hypothetical protein
VVSTDSYGASFQLTLLGRPAGMDNQFIAGVAADLANSQYTAASQCASVTDSRATIGIGNYVQQTDAKTRSANYGIYFHDVLSLTRQWSFTLAGRHNWASAQIGDESSMQPLLDGRHVFPRFNPSVGINWTPPPASRPTRHTTRVCARRRPSNWLARTPPHPARYRTTFWRTRR